MGAEAMQAVMPAAELTNICDGAAVQHFKEAFEKVVRNCLDPATPFKKKRTLTLTFTIETNPDRNELHVAVDSAVKLAQPLGAAGTVFYGLKRNGEIVATVHNPKQHELFTDPPAQPTLVKDEAAPQVQAAAATGTAGKP